MNEIKTESMNQKKELSDRDAEKIMECIGDLYRQTKLRVDLAEHDAPNRMPSPQCLDDRSFLYKIDRSLQNCQKETQLVIRKQYLEISDKNWYEEFFSKPGFRKILLKSIRELFEVMDLA